MDIDSNLLKIISFGVVGVVGGILIFAVSGRPDAAIMFAGFIGMPAWFIGLLEFGLWSDKMLGVDGAFAYEVPKSQRESDDSK